jgi:hypothetical protein
MAKANRKAREQAIFDKVLSGKKIKLWNRNNLYYPIRRTDTQQNKRKFYYQESQKLVNKKHLLRNAQKEMESLKDKIKKNKLLKQEQQIQNGWKIAKSWKQTEIK